MIIIIMMIMMMMMMMTRGTELGTWKMGVTSYAPVARDDNNNNDDHDDDDDDSGHGARNLEVGSY